MSADNSTVYVKIDERFGVEKSLRKFKRLCESYGVVKEYRKRQDYKKPSLKLKEKAEAAVKRKAKNEFRSNRYSKV